MSAFWMASICTSSAIVLQEVLFLTTFRGQKMDVVAMSRILTALQIFQRHTLTSNSAKNYHGSWNKGVTIHSAVVILLRWYSLCKTMYRPAKSVDWCQCCQQGVTLTDAQGASNLLRNHNSPQIIHSSDNASCFHISFSFIYIVGRGLAPAVLVHLFCGGSKPPPYNNFTNYAVSICKLTEIIPQYLLFTFAML